MHCLQCQHDNRDTARFCAACGSALALPCPSCRNVNPAAAAFCDNCGTPLLTSLAAPLHPQPLDMPHRMPDEQLSQTATAAVEPTTLDAERRQLTVLFCDLVDSTRLAEQLDPEDLRDLVRSYQAICAEVVQRFSGYIAQYLGDGLLIYFGYPQAHEDDAPRAVHAGLEMIKALAVLKRRLRQERNLRLAVRVGIHTGLVVVGTMGDGERQEQLALGETPNLAARIQDLAGPDMVVISAATHHLVQGYFVCQAMGLQQLKGFSQPLAVHQVLHTSGAERRFDVMASRGLTPLVGRDNETALLLKHWEQARDGTGQVVLIHGEAGMGKSRLLQVMKEHIAHEPHIQLACHCSPYHQNSALYPVVDLLQRVLRLRQAGPPEEQLHKLERLLSQYGVEREIVPLLAALLPLSIPTGRYPPLRLTSRQQRHKTLDAILALLMALATQQPVLLIVEDLHWIDPSSLELLDLLLEQVPIARLFVLLTCQPVFQPPWTNRPYLTHLTLSRLSPPQVEQMIRGVAASKALPAEVIQELVRKTDGVPLFIEELTKMVLESGLLVEKAQHYELSGPLPPLAIPATLQDSLMARLDRLASAKTVVQLAATIGRSFSYALIEAVSSLPHTVLQEALARLVQAELLYQQGVPPQATYLFKHALIQETAYQSLLRGTRRQYHRQIGQVLAEHFPGLVETQPELLAYHYTEAGLYEQGILYWQQAGQRAVQHSAYVEAVHHLNRGLELLTMLPDTTARTHHELLLRTHLGPALMAVKGYAAPEVEYTYARARALCEQVEESPQLFPVLRGLYTYYIARADYQTVRLLVERLLTVAQLAQDTALLLEAHRALGLTLFYVGEFAAARHHLEQSFSLYDRQRHHAQAFLYGQDSGVVCLAFTALTLWVLGYPAQALAQSRQALALARDLSHPLSQALALDLAAGLQQFRREAQGVQEQADALVALATEHGFPFWRGTGTVKQGWARVEQGDGEAGIEAMHQGLAAVQATGTSLVRPSNLARLAEAYLRVNRLNDGLQTVSEALHEVQKSGEQYYEAELYRLQGELLLQAAGGRQTAALQAEACFQQALAIAGRQQARAWELRAAMSLSRLWQQQGKRQAAREVLAAVYGWFTEGFDTSDLQEAQAQLVALQ